jgi:hypothetical protein
MTLKAFNTITHVLSNLQDPLLDESRLKLPSAAANSEATDSRESSQKAGHGS